MRSEFIEIGHADDGFRAQLHQNTSTENPAEGIFLQRPSFAESFEDLESNVWRPRVKEWLVLSCVSLVAMLDAFDATMMVPIIPVGLNAFLFPQSAKVSTCSVLPTGSLGGVRTATPERTLGRHVVLSRQCRKQATVRHVVRSFRSGADPHRRRRYNHSWDGSL